MSIKLCYLQELCVDFRSGDTKPPNHDVRTKIPCQSFLDMSCELSVLMQIKCGETLACPIDKKVKKGG